MIKRAFDLVAATIGLILLSPLMAVIAVLIKRDSDGPVIFKQERVGLGGKPFNLLKFRTMANGPRNAGPLVTSANDPRITRLGARLRSSKLDELPQLVNVVRGDMSFVGPRPEVHEYVSVWPLQDRKLVLSVRPGITDPVSILLVREEELLAGQDDPELYYRLELLPKKLRAYRAYVEMQSLSLDARITTRTIAVVVRSVPTLLRRIG